MTTSSVGASAPVTTPATPIATTAVALGLDPVADEQHDQLVALADFLHDLTSNDGRAVPSELRLRYQQLAPEHRPIALQALEPYRASMHLAFATIPSHHPPGQIADLRRFVERLDEVGTTTDTPSLASPELSEQSLATFTALLQHAQRMPGTERALRDLFATMSDDDRLAAIGQLTALRDSESRRIQGIVSANNGEVDPSEFALLERLANVDAPVGPAGS